VPTIGVLPRTITTTRGNRTSTMATRTTTIRTTQTIANRTKGNFYNVIEKQNQIARDHKPTKEEQQAFQSSMNSYLGIMKHYKSYKLRKGMIFKNLSGWWWNYVNLSGGICKFEMKTKTI
jgi:RNA-directed DNA polymerase